MRDAKTRLLRFDNVEIDVQNLRVTVGSEIRPLEPKSFRLLLFLAENPGRVLAKEEIMEVVWPDAVVSDNSLARAIAQVRKTLDDNPKAPRYVETVPTIGYRFLVECKEEPATSSAEPAPTSAPVPVEVLRKPWLPIAAAALGIGVLALGAIWWFRAARNGRPGSALLRNANFVQLTDQPGEELYPCLSPDGKSLVYASPISGNWDIYSKRVGGSNPVNLTKDSPVNDTQPALSPDGEQIAFRSEREGGGIFVMGATGENVKRITNVGHDPAWSPDGKQIAYATTLANPGLRLTSESQVFSVNLATGAQRSLTPENGIAMQPTWSPHGYRIAYWAQVQGVMDVWTIPAGGGEAVRVTNDAALDWDPVWSPDGAFLYLASDRGGSMNLWRVSMDEKSGEVLGELEPVTTPSSYAGYISFSRSGREMAYAQRTLTVNVYRVAFDASRETTVGQPMPVTQGSLGGGSPAVSPDGEWITFVRGQPQTDIFVVRKDGSGMRQLTNDARYSRRPVWSPDGKLVTFFSNRGGRFDVWTIHPDGSDLRQVTHTTQGALTHPVWSPDGKRLLYSVMNGTPVVIDADKPWSSQTPQVLPPLPEPGTMYEASSWSPDGRKLAGFQLRADGIFNGTTIYSFDTRTYARVADFGIDPHWLNDGRRLLFTRGDPPGQEVYLVDSESRKIHPVLSVAPNAVRATVLSADERWIYFAQQITEADIWMANLH